MRYLDLFSALDRFRIDYLVIGGLAMTLHGVERSTMDIDLTISTEPENLSALLEAVTSLGLVPMLPVPLETLADLPTLRRWHEERNMHAFSLREPTSGGITVDILPFPPVDFTEMSGRAVTFDVTGVPVRVAAIDDLIALKQAAGRPLDLADIEHLSRLRKA